MDAPVRIENRAQLIYLLTEAAELEHGVMCSYLFAAFSIKQDVKEGVTEEQLLLVGLRRPELKVGPEQACERRVCGRGLERKRAPFVPSDGWLIGGMRAIGRQNASGSERMVQLCHQA